MLRDPDHIPKGITYNGTNNHADDYIRVLDHNKGDTAPNNIIVCAQRLLYYIYMITENKEMYKSSQYRDHDRLCPFIKKKSSNEDNNRPKEKTIIKQANVVVTLTLVGISVVSTFNNTPPPSKQTNK